MQEFIEITFKVLNHLKDPNGKKMVFLKNYWLFKGIKGR